MRNTALSHERRASAAADKGQRWCSERTHKTEAYQLRRAALHAAVIISDPNARTKLSESLSKLGIRHHNYDAQQYYSRLPTAGLFCVCARTVAILGAVPSPAIVVCCGMAVPDNVVSLVSRAGTQVMNASSLSPKTLLQAIVNTVDDSTPCELALKLYLTSHPCFQRVPIELIDHFVTAPFEVMRLGYICLALQISRPTCRALLRSAGFERAEHLCTALRAEAWIWFAQQGIRRAVFEEYLGIRDRKTFRRACCRAAVEVPWQNYVRDTLMAPPNGKGDSNVRSAPPNARSASSSAKQGTPI